MRRFIDIIAEASFDAFKYDEDGTGEEWRRELPEIKARANAKHVELDIEGGIDSINLVYIGRMNGAKRGDAAEIIRALCRLADQHNLMIHLAVAGGMKGLVRYYERFGFEMDYNYAEDPHEDEDEDSFGEELTMTREPVVPGLRESVESDAFRKWFGGSEVVDEHGKPLVVYHGGKSWRIAPGTTWFTDSPHIADGYADQGFEDAEIKPCYLRIERPLDLRDPHVAEEVFGDDYADDDTMRRSHKIRAWREPVQDAIEYAQRYGYDGVIHYDSGVTNHGSHTSYVVFHPNQVKAARFQGWEGDSIYGAHARFDQGNAGTYSLDDHDITR